MDFVLLFITILFLAQEYFLLLHALKTLILWVLFEFRLSENSESSGVKLSQIKMLRIKGKIDIYLCVDAAGDGNWFVEQYKT